MPYNDSENSFLHRFLPFLIWFKGYQISTFRSDALAGVTVAVVLIPQAMAYAMLVLYTDFMRLQSHRLLEPSGVVYASLPPVPSRL